MKFSIILLMAIFMCQVNGQGFLTKCQAERQQALNLHVIGYCVCVDTNTGVAISEPVGPTGDLGKLPC
ncbi:hypothetical protein V8B55DRAFT_1439908 [Mucor lusitanicus]|uniref:Thyroglobulin type-1 domain-containing protein n=1 Tax=Mucor lusitanicus CBS 277.49 TaxID=747725 RepID=A0A168N7I4_MUCCL|nr:hypothetical protein MUCCIDRAFT_106458 [Mucor lusitanicus CBS 277.49]